MRSFPWLAALSFITVGTLSAQSASAQSEATPDSATSPPSEVKPLDPPSTSHLHLNSQLGGYGGGGGGGLALGALILFQTGMFEAGAQGQLGGGIFNYRYASLGAVAGVGLSPFEQWRLDLLGELGADSYAGVDAGWILSSDPGARAVLPYAGARIALSRSFGAFELGVSSGYANDLGRKHVSYSYSNSDGYDGRAAIESRTVRVGTDRLGAMLSLGCGFDL